VNDCPHPSEKRHLRGAVTRARRLRREATGPERLLWLKLREQQLGFRRQVPIGRYIVDFVDHQAKLIVELDGGQHAEAPGLAYDAERSVWLEERGYRVLRFWNTEVFENLDGVLEIIVRAVSPSPQPSPVEGEGAALQSAAHVSSHGASPSPLTGEGRGEGALAAIPDQA
jgi:very-short-patch-repair endonuclease